MGDSGQNLLLEAISFAARKHHGQLRKDNRTPYAAHPMRVMTVLCTEFGVTDAEVLAAAVLHDTIEDTTTDYDEIVERFGPRVAGFISLLTKDKRLPEEDREERYFADLAAAPLEVKLCKLGDTYDNLADSRSLTPEGRRKAVSKAEKLLAAFGPTMPDSLRPVLDKVRERMEQCET